MKMKTFTLLSLLAIFTVLAARPAYAQAALNSCDDNDPCTIDVEDVCGNCFHIRVDCSELDCDDGDPCTVDVVDISGNCLHFPKDCDDGNPATIDYCDNWGNCQHTPVDCDDDDPTTTDYAGPDGQCHHVREVCCDDDNPCTEDVIDPQTGECTHLPRCDDGDPCTIDYCNPNTGACTHQPNPNCNPCQGVNCDDGNPCTIDFCDPTTGACIHKPRNCDDGDPCTIDSCNPYTGACIHKPDPNCTPCQGVDCDDDDPCTIDYCNPYTGNCIHKPRDCDDGNPCTTDYCNPYNGACIHKPIPNCNPCQGVNCNDGDPCTIDTCDPYTGQCLHTPNPSCQQACSFTQGFWGNAGGSFNGQTTTQILQGILANGPLVVGVVGHRSISISLANLDCVFTLLPGGGNAAALPANTGDINVQEPNCAIAPIPAYGDGRIQNILLAQTMTLALNVRYDVNLRNLPLEDACISFPAVILNSLPANPTVLDLLNHANRVLAGLANTTPSTVSAAVATVNEFFDECHQICTDMARPGEQGPEAMPGSDEARAFAEDGLHLYPNPTSGELMVSLKQYQGLPARLIVYSMLGGLVHEQEFSELPAEAVRLELSGLSSGLYFLKVRIAGEQEMGKEFVLNRD